MQAYATITIAICRGPQLAPAYDAEGAISGVAELAILLCLPRIRACADRFATSSIVYATEHR